MLQFAPGPIRIPNSIRETFLEDVPYFASKDFSVLFQSVQKKLQEVFDTKNFVLTGNGSGSLGMEIAVMSFFNPGDSVAVITSGKYGDNWCKMCNSHKLNTTKFDASYCKTSYSVDEFEMFCRYHRDLKGVFVTHFETTSGVLNPIEEYLNIYRSYGGTGLFIVDAISSLLTEPLNSDRYDVVIGASQKALSLPPGLFFMSVSDRALEVACFKDIKNELLYYFDLVKEYGYQMAGKSVFTTSAHLIKALDVSLTTILRRGVPYVINTCKDNSEFIRKNLKSHFSRFPIDEGNAVSVFEFERSVELVAECYKRGLLLGSGIRDLRENTFRVMAFGWDLSVSSMIQACKIIKTVKKEMK